MLHSLDDLGETLRYCPQHKHPFILCSHKINKLVVGNFKAHLGTNIWQVIIFKPN